MDVKYKLTVAILTRNRADQLREAIESCLEASLPIATQFIVVDNASTDCTQDVVEELKQRMPYSLVYHKENENLGVGGGRNRLFDLAEGEYVYFLDDDAIINPKDKDNFFLSAIEYLDAHTQVASLTTQIIDEIFGVSRTETAQTKQIGGKPIAMRYCGGSHFLRKSCFSSPLYFNLQYGAEEDLPSIRAIDQGFYHVIDNEISIIHKPRTNKWVDGTEKMKDILVKAVSNVYATKKLLYPVIFYPILYLGYKRRCKKHLSAYLGAKIEAKETVRNIIKNNKVKKIKLSTVIKMYRDFGMTVF